MVEVHSRLGGGEKSVRKESSRLAVGAVDSDFPAKKRNLSKLLFLISIGLLHYLINSLARRCAAANRNKEFDGPPCSPDDD